MRIGVAGPMSLELLDFNERIEELPSGYPFPMISMFINSLLKKGKNVVAFTSSPGIKISFIKETENLILCVIPQTIHPARSGYKSEIKELVRLMQRYSCDIIHCHWSYEFALAALKTNIPTIVTLHDHASIILNLMIKSNYNIATKIHWLIRFFINKIVLSNSKYLSVNSAYLYNLLPNKYKAKTRIIYNFYPPELESDFISIEQKKNIIVSVNNGFNKRKNIDTAIKAFQIVRDIFPDLEYYLIGKEMGSYEVAYNYANKYNLQQGIKFIGWIKYGEVSEIISKAKIFLHPSREESFGMAVLESMVLGTSVIGGDKSGNIPALLENGKAGILCDINSPQEIANSIIKLYSNPKLNENLRKNAYNSVHHNYTEDKIIEQNLSYYSDVLNKDNKL